jgi:hypothetical protein
MLCDELTSINCVYFGESYARPGKLIWEKNAELVYPEHEFDHQR